jgi:hypothetical protein
MSASVQRHGVYPNGRATTRVRGLAPWQPQQATRELLALVQSVLVEYAKYLPITIRQIFYRLIGAHGYPKSEKAYKNLGEKLNRARRAGIIPFNSVRDDGITLAEPLAWDGPEELVRTFLVHADQFRLDRQIGQLRRLIFAVEAAGMVPQIERIAAPYGIAVQSAGGFDSLTCKHDLALKLGEWPAVEILHIGDYDPSGAHIFSSLAEDVQALARDLGKAGELMFSRLVVTRRQIDELRLPTAPPKETDRRSFNDTETVQAEAIPPDVLARIVQEAIDQRVASDIYRDVLERETCIRQQLGEKLIPLLDEPWGDADFGE